MSSNMNEVPPDNIFSLFQHEWPNDTAAPVLAQAKIQPPLDARAAVGNLLKKDTVRKVLEERGVLDYWRDFPENFFGDRSVYGDGSTFFRSAVRKLRRAATRTPKPPPAPAGAGVVKPYDPVRQKIKNEIPSSYMPSSTPPQVKSLVAVYMTESRWNELGLNGFDHFEPLIARVRRVIDSETFECQWLASQPVHGEAMENGLTDGYNGRWEPWEEEDGTVPLTILHSADIYAANFKLFPDSQKMCGSLKKILKRALNIFKGVAEEDDDMDEEL